jgi:hypothetical protein
MPYLNLASEHPYRDFSNYHDLPHQLTRIKANVEGASQNPTTQDPWGWAMNNGRWVFVSY